MVQGKSHLPPSVGAAVTEPPVSWEVGQRVLATASFDGKKHAAEIVHKRSVGTENHYYVHYTKYDKRLDEWLKWDKLSVYEPGVDDADDGGKASCNGHGSTTRRSKRKLNDPCIAHSQGAVLDGHPANGGFAHSNGHSARHEEHTPRVKNIGSIELGKYEMDTWYYSPYPDEYRYVDKLFLCEWCLKYMRKRKTLIKHALKCNLRSPPGPLIYQHPPREGIEDLCMFEIDGAQHKLYGQNLCLLGKLFLDHKTLYFDVEHFFFYVLCERSERGYHIVGYFSKEKESADDFNLACIVTLPPYQRKGYGTFLIDFSYLLSRAECKHGTPERPLSDLGQVSYRLYWQRVILQYLKACVERSWQCVSLEDVSNDLCFKYADVKDALEQLNMLRYHKGNHYVELSSKTVDEKLAKFRFDVRMQLDPARLNWVPS